MRSTRLPLDARKRPCSRPLRPTCIRLRRGIDHPLPLCRAGGRTAGRGRESALAADSPANSSAVSEQLSDACRASADPAVRQWARKSQRARVCPRHLGRDCALRSSRCGRCGRLRGPGEPPAAASAKAGGTGGRVSWRDYGQGMDQRLTDRCKVSSWECIAPPAQPMHIPKPDGGERQLDIGAREDRIDR